MIETSPVWRTRLSFKDGRKFYFATHGVALTEQYVAFTWFCIDRNTGALRWQWEENSTATELFAVHEGVLIANTTGTYWDREDLYLTRLDDGVKLPQPRNFWERVFTEGGRGLAPVALGENAVLNASGSAISLITGRRIGLGNPEEFHKPPLRFGDRAHTSDGELLPGGGRLRVNHEAIWTEGENPWRLSAKDLEIRIDSRVFHYPYAYLAIHRGDWEAASDQWLWTLDLRNGQIVQRVPLSREPTTSGAVHTIDDSGLVASIMHRLPNKEQGGIRWVGELIYFSRNLTSLDSAKTER